MVGGVPTGAGLVDGGGRRGQGRVGLAGQGLGGSKGFGSGGVGGRGTGPRVVFYAYKKKKNDVFLFFEGCPVGWGGPTREVDGEGVRGRNGVF